MSARELTVLIVLCAVWGFHFVIIKLAVTELPPIFYAAIRMTLVAAILSPLLRWRAGHMARILGAAVCLGAVNYALMFTGLKFATASAAAIAMQLYTPFATILAVFFFKDKLGWRRAAGIGLAFTGVAIIALGKPDSADAEARIAFGVGLVAAGALVEAVGAILVKQSKAFTPHELLAWFSLVGMAGLWMMTYFLETGQREALAVSDHGFILVAILYSAFGGSIFGHAAYYWLLQRLPISLVASSVPLTTLFAVLSSVVFLGEPFGPRMFMGALLTIMGVGVVILRGAGKPAIKRAVTEPGIAP